MNWRPFTPRGARLAAELAQSLNAQGDEANAYASGRCAAAGGLPPMGGVAAWTRERFDAADALVFVGAAGIAVRAIAPCLRSKLTDPAVVAVDEAGRYAVSLLSGHVGGANRLARRIAALTGGQAVVSTATDVNGRFSVDEWIARQGMAMCNPKAARAFAAALLEGRPVGLASDFPIAGGLPEASGSTVRRAARTEPAWAACRAAMRLAGCGICAAAQRRRRPAMWAGACTLRRQALRTRNRAL